MIKCGFFNSVDGDRKYNADDFNNYFDGVISSTGVFKKYGNAFRITAQSQRLQLSAAVQSGKAKILDKWIISDSDVIVNFDNADVALNRIDLVVLRLNNQERTITIEVVKGENAQGQPQQPSPTQTEDIYEIVLAAVNIYAGSTTLTDNAITDMRGHIPGCPWMKIEVDAIDCGFEQFEKTITPSASVSSVGLSSYGINYDVNNDVLMVLINGMMLARDLDYTVLSNGLIKFNRGAIGAGNEITLRVIKSIVAVL